MAIFACLSPLLVGKKKKLLEKNFRVSKKYTPTNQESPKATDGITKESSTGDPGMKAIDLLCHPAEDGLKESHFTESRSFSSPGKRSLMTQKQLSSVSVARTDSGGAAPYEGSNEDDETQSMKKVHSDLDLQAKGEVVSHGLDIHYKGYGLEKKFEVDEQPSPEAMDASRHLSEPGVERTDSWGSPLLKRSCSSIETRQINRSNKPLKRSLSYSNPQNFCGNHAHGTPFSVKTSYSADHVMLKKWSLSQILPSRSRKVWWKLFLWSHRKLHNTIAPQRLASVLSARNDKDGYSSATHEPREETDSKKTYIDTENQWAAFSLGSSHMDRVIAWVNSLDACHFCPLDDDDGDEAGEGIAESYHSNVGESSAKKRYQTSFFTGDVMVQANGVVQSLNSFSSAALMSGIGLKVIPSMAAFVNLRTVNLSDNMIAHITAGTLPRSLHTLDLSRNKLSTIEGLRELTRLRVLNLSYNQISKFGHGLSSCTLIKDLYLAGNKISYIEGLHRLLKLAVLDLSFNRITTAKALAQLVANYNSVMAINLLGNPVHGNVGDEQLKKTVTSLLPHLTYLNKQPLRPQRVRDVALRPQRVRDVALRPQRVRDVALRPQRVREVASDCVAKASLGDPVSSRRKSSKRLAYSSCPSMQSRTGEGSSRSRKHRSRSKKQQPSFGRK